MADSLEKRANAAFIDEDYERAVELFTEAFAADPQNASLLVSRAQAHIKLENYTDAVSDATKAIELDPSLSKAYLRKGVACFSLEEYETAKAAFLAALEHEPSNSQYKNWIQKCNAALAEEAANDQAHLKEEALPSESPRLNGLNGLQTNANFHSDSKVSAPQAEMAAALQRKPAPKYRHDFYQNANEVVVEIFAKGLKPENLNIDFGVQSLSVVISVPPDTPYVFNTRLNQKIVIEKCKYNILGTKVEIRLAKAEMLQWKSLEYSQSQIAVQAKPVPSAATETKAYPSSSKKAHKDWDKIEAQVKEEEKDEKLEGDAALNKLFRDIYQNADEDTRRAMNKSFVESNGTVLSTNWKEVGTKHVDGSPPSGMEMKKWEV